MEASSPHQDVGSSVDARAQWVHSLRNSANTAGVTLAMARRLLEHGDTAGARDMLDRCDAAWSQMRDLLQAATRATALYPDAAPLTSREDARAPASPPPRR